MTETPAGTRIFRYTEVASTNAEAMRLALDGEPVPFWLTTELQTAGKGRSGRSWSGSAGNLFASYVLRTVAPPALAHQLSLVAGVAVYDAVRALSVSREAGLRLKWPNDLLVGRSKVGGILVESTMAPDKQLTVVIGVGLNLVSHPDIEGRETADLAGHGATAAPGEALMRLDDTLTYALQLWQDGSGFDTIRSLWLDRAGPEGEAITIQGTGQPVTGRYTGLDEDGALLIEMEGGERRRCTYGDVTLA